jgi:predicted nucleic acid-binding protein
LGRTQGRSRRRPAISLVLDSSATLAWIYAEEPTASIRKVFVTLHENGAWVPTHWALEVANVLEMGVRRGRHDAAFRDATLADLALLPVSLDPHTSREAWGNTLRLAELHRLTLYDAAYLELAKRIRLPLATLDKDLGLGARAEGVIVLGQN